MKKIRKAVIPAAGWGTRFLPATKAMPKEMLPIVDTPTIQYIVEEAVASGIEEICLITSGTKKAIEDHFDKTYELEDILEKGGKTALLRQVQRVSNLVSLTTVRQKEQRGLGHAIACARSFVGDEPFAVLLGDDVVYHDGTPCLKQLMDVYADCGVSVLGVQTVPLSEISKYGCVDGPQVADRLYRVKRMVEKPKPEEAPGNVAVLGRYIITPEIFSHLDRTAPGAGGEIQLTDALCSLAAEQEMYAYDFIGRRYDVGDREGYLEATVEFALRREELREPFLRYLKGIVRDEKTHA